MFYTSMLDLCLAKIPYYSKCGIDSKNYLNTMRSQLLKIQDDLNLFTNRFDYENLPDDFKDISGHNKHFETLLFFAPAIAFFKDTKLGLQALPCTGEFKYNIAGFPTKWRVFGMNGYQKELTENDSVIMFNDYAFSIPFLSSLYEDEFLIECDNTYRQNLHAQRQPTILEIDEDEKKSAEKFVNKLNDFSDTIVTRVRHREKDKKIASTNPYNTHTFQSGRAFEGDKISAAYRYFENRKLTRWGYNNENMEKKERLLVDEINANNAVIDSYYTTHYECRKEAIDKINSMFGYNISIKPKLMQTIMTKNEKEKDNVPTNPDTSLQ